MKNNFKCVILLLFVFFLTGCGGWEDIEKNYTDYFGLSCEYVNNKAIDGISSFQLGLNESELYIKYNGVTNHFIINNNNKTSFKHNVNGVNFHYNQATVELFIEKYISNNNECPSQLYVYKESVNDTYYVMSPYSCSSGNNCYSYSHNGKSSNVTDDKNRLCTYGNAVSCKKYAIEYDKDNAYLDETLYFELGKTSSGKYITVCDNRNYDSKNGGCVTETIDKDLYYLSLGDNKYYINEQDIDLLFSGTNYPGTEEVIVEWAPNGAHKGSIFYIMHKNSENSYSGDSLGSEDPEDVEDPNHDTTIPEYERESLDYGELCANEGVLDAIRIIGYLVTVAKWIVPLIIIIMGMIDFGKAVISSDEKALNQATSTLIKRIIAGVVVFIIPGLILAVLDVIKIGGIENTTRFDACTKCILDAPTYCPVGKK